MLNGIRIQTDMIIKFIHDRFISYYRIQKYIKLFGYDKIFKTD
jgi:hypothetical protein